ncbi:hypothetical protein CNBK1300 [Cryptococcus deneoformans B-3501A]|uniref:hypothetical protein n=1 Tax=Cryptococcus deneoformans (strain B-3501A) TaxID=283643 RepID=UPI000042DF49|nr:hypothetical protein CNBK1300 [Cryptococcus neoformans var. neoformans B-3501A]EAL18109.1 hypothetical protein CNBK1300 [Cryptococcus neoformans var. neoformans B-3501A]
MRRSHTKCKTLSNSDPSADYNPKARGRKAATSGSKNRATKKRRALRPGVCHNCGCTEAETTLWRSNPDRLGKGDRTSMLCNACGLWRAEHGFNRPKDYQGRSKAAQLFSANTCQSSPFTSLVSFNQPELPLEIPSNKKRKGSSFTSTTSTTSSSWSSDSYNDSSIVVTASTNDRKAEGNREGSGDERINPDDTMEVLYAAMGLVYLANKLPFDRLHTITQRDGAYLVVAPDAVGSEPQIYQLHPGSLALYPYEVLEEVDRDELGSDTMINSPEFVMERESKKKILPSTRVTENKLFARERPFRPWIDSF